MRMIHSGLTQLANRYVGLNTVVVFDGEAVTEDQREAVRAALEKLEDELEEVSGEIPIQVSPLYTAVLDAAREIVHRGPKPKALDALAQSVANADLVRHLVIRKDALETKIDEARRQLRSSRFVLNTLEGDHTLCGYHADTAEQMKAHILAASAEMAVSQ